MNLLDKLLGGPDAIDVDLYEMVEELAKSQEALLQSLDHYEQKLPVIVDEFGKLPAVEYHELHVLGNHKEFIPRGSQHAQDGEFDPATCPYCRAKAALEAVRREMVER